jgi:hypothetical protein
MSEEEVIQIIRERLSIRIKSSSSYTGGMDGRPLYENYWAVQLLLDNEVISEDWP